MYKTEPERLELLASVRPQWCDTFSVTVCCRVWFFSSDDTDHRSSHTNIAQASSVPFAPPQMPVSASMPWLGSGQTSMGASVVRISVLHKHHPNGSWRLCLVLRSADVLSAVVCSLTLAHFKLCSGISAVCRTLALQFPLDVFNSYQYSAELMSTKQLAC